ncbi:MAG TPA: class I SAM-dependent methyltransferase, partial [Bryobacteraceae bacterium]|nr:class I SAM-dependent methyltransferase [Bryobacteraceae bacterium]
MSSIATSRAPLSYREHLKKTAEFYDTEPPCSSWASRQYRRCLGHYYRLLIPPEASVLEVGCGGGELLALLPNRSLTGIDVSRRQIERARARVPGGRFFVAAGEEFSAAGEFDCIILSDVIGITADVQQLFSNLKRVSHRRTRLVINYHNLLWRPL